MDKYLLCGSLLRSGLSGCEPSESSSGLAVYKGRKRGTVRYFGIWRHLKSMKELVADGVKIMHSLDHINVLKFHEWYETPKHIWVITELASGGTLAEILEQDGAISPDKAGTFIRDIASGLSYLHLNGVLYCDLQPRKVILDTCESLKLSDFTLAQPATQPHHNTPGFFVSSVRTWFQIMHTSSSSSRENKALKMSKPLSLPLPPPAETADYLYSPFYAAPELFLGSEFSTASDLWSFGCVVFEMLTDHQPFCGSCLESLQKAIQSGSDGGMITGAEGGVVNRELGVWSELVCNLLHRSPAERYSWEDINNFLSSSSSPSCH